MAQPDFMQTDVSLAEFTTMNMGGTAAFFGHVKTREQLEAGAAWAKTEDLPVFILGEGSNLIVSDGVIKAVVLKLEIGGFEAESAEHGLTRVTVGGGEHWDDVVKQTVDMGLTGLETLSMIPGTAGAAPVQNAGAYGGETADHLVDLEAYDLRAGEWVTLAATDCRFGYRTSRFREEDAGRYAITQVRFDLRLGEPDPARYERLSKRLADDGITSPTGQQLRETVMVLRAKVLPDPSVVPSAGSFFKNPIVDEATLRRLQSDFGDIKSFSFGQKYKLAAGWLLEQCGFKGSNHFGLQIWPEHALVITNPHHRGYADLMKLVELMQDQVQEKFGIELEPEPLFLNK